MKRRRFNDDSMRRIMISNGRTTIFNPPFENYEKQLMIMSILSAWVCFTVPFQITMNDRNHQMKLTSMDEEIQRLKQKHQDDLKDFEFKANRERQRVQDAHASSEQTLRDQLSKLENIRSALERVSALLIILFPHRIDAFVEQEIQGLKSSLATQKLNHDESIQDERARIRAEEEKRQQEIEDRLRTVMTTKDELEVSSSSIHSFRCSTKIFL